MAGTEYRGFWKYLKKGRKLYPLWKLGKLGLFRVRYNHMARTLHHEKRAVNPLLKTPLTFLSD
jgi:hypothetical protein